MIACVEGGWACWNGAISFVYPDFGIRDDPVYGPQTLGESNLDDIHRMRRGALNELYGRLEQAHRDGAFDRIARIEAQIDGPIAFEQGQLHYTSLTSTGLWNAPFAAVGYLH